MAEKYPFWFILDQLEIEDIKSLHVRRCDHQTSLKKWLSTCGVTVGQQPSSIIVSPREDIYTFPRDKRPLIVLVEVSSG